MKLGLTMIVRDESHVIGRCLDSVFGAGIIDTFAIVDTGSSDNTIDIIEQKAKQYNVQGTVITKWFTDFADCRNVALDGLRGDCDWAFWIDADEVLVNKSENLKRAIAEFTEKQTCAWIEANQGNISMMRTNLFKITKNTVWKGMVHEYVTLLGSSSPAIFDGMSINVYSEGNSWKNETQKFKNYAKLLMKQIEAEPEEPRWVYFLADTLRNLKTLENDKQAIDAYIKRISMLGGNEEEVYVSRLMVASLKRKVYGIYDYDILNYDYPTRVENRLIFASFKMEQGYLEDALIILRAAMNFIGKKPQASLFVDLKTYLFTVPYFLANVCLNLGHFDEAISAIKDCEAAIKCANESEIRILKSYKEKLKQHGYNC